MVLAHGLAGAMQAHVPLLSAAQEVYRRTSAGGQGERDVSILGESWRRGVKT
jgi:3-hydroxyisobutyrate dehydrogenase-like beta-hydroxyacid dehydrogenase